jgi:K+-transporting ATPase ATPase C chain
MVLTEPVVAAVVVAMNRLQLARVARLRQVPETELLQLLNDHTAARTLGLLGEPRVNVLQLNLALDARQPSIAVSE